MNVLGPVLSLPFLLFATAPVAWSGPSIAMAQASNAALERYAGSYRYIGGEAEIQALDRAIDEVVDQMNFLIRGIARRRLRAPNLPSKTVRVVVAQGQIRIERPGQPEVSAPADGTPITWRHPIDGDVFQVSHGLDAKGVLYQRFEGKQSISRNRFVLSHEEERLTIHTTITANRLPAPLRFEMSYERVPVDPKQ
jgi:hypothetical protein